MYAGLHHDLSFKLFLWVVRKQWSNDVNNLLKLQLAGRSDNNVARGDVMTKLFANGFTLFLNHLPALHN